MSIALDDLALKRARLRAKMQPRNDQTINELPILGLPVASDLIPAWRNGETFQTTAALIASLGSASSTTSLGIFNVKAFGATGNGVTDDTNAINAAISAAQIAGGGVVYFPFGQYVISSTLTITASYVGLLGVGKNMSKLIMGTAGMTAIQFIGGGTGASSLRNNYVSGLSAWQNNLTQAGIGISLYYTTVTVLQDIQVSGFFVGFSLQRATSGYALRCIAAFNPSAPGLNGAIGWLINGNSAAGDPVIQGNASFSFVQCDSDMSPNGGYANVSTGSIGFSALGAYVGDLTFRDCGTSYAYYGFSINLTAALVGGSDEDIFIDNCTIDYYTTQAILISGPGDGLSMVNINDGWIDPYPAAVNPVGVYCNAVAGVRIRGLQGYQNTTPIQTLVYLNGCSDCDIDVQCVNQKYGVYVFGSTDCSVGGRFFANATYPATVHVNVTGSTRISIKGGSIFDGYATVGAQFDAGTSYSVLVGATFNPAHITTPVANSGTHNQIAKNPGYNPVGNIAAPTFPASNTIVTNNSGLDLMVLVTAGAAAITVASVGGVTLLGYTVPITTLGSPIRLPAGQTIAFTYASGSPTWQWFAD